MTIKDALKLGIDSEILLAHVLHKDRAWLFANPDYKLSHLQLTTYNLLLRRHSRGEPVAYLTGHKEFYGLDFSVNKNVLIPRPETELLVELAIKIATSPPTPPQAWGGWPKARRGRNVLNIIDVGTGSGCIIISIAKNLPVISGLDHLTPGLFAIDNSKTALAVAHTNARRHGVNGKIKFLHGDLLSPLQEMERDKGRGRTIIIANLPYLTTAQYNSNPGLRHEPKQALVAGKDGLKFFRELFRQLKAIHNSPSPPLRLRGGWGALTVLLEFDPRQKNKLAVLAKKYFPHSKTQFYKDLACKIRVMKLTV